MQQLKKTMAITKESYQQHLEAITHHQQMFLSKYKFDCSIVVVDPKNWDSYAPFLISSLGLTGESDKNMVMGMRYTDSDQWNTYDFMIEYDFGGTYTESYIKLFFRKEDRKYHICFFRVKSEHTLKWRQEYFINDSLLKASLEYKTCSEAYNHLRGL